MNNPGTERPLAENVHIEPHGISGLQGAVSGVIRRETRHPGFDTAFWVASPSRDYDLHAGFQATFALATDTQIDLAVQCSSNFRVIIDGEVVVRGPLRYAPAIPEFHSEHFYLAAGVHTIAVHAIGEGLTTRVAAGLPAFVWVQLCQAGADIELEWSGRELTEYIPTGLRVSPLLGWVEWQATPFAQPWWTEDPAAWGPVQRVDLSRVLGPISASELPLKRWSGYLPQLIQTGTYRDTYTGYEMDDIGTQFLLADDDPDPSDDLDGFWWRYDLGRVRIGAMEFTVTAPDRSVVTIAYAERLTPEGRPAPVVALSAGPTRMIQHFTVAAGTTVIQPLQSLGARYVEIRVQGTGRPVVSNETFRERDILGEPTGRLDTDDPLLNAIWMTGINTLRSSSEDSVVDPVRERGEWVGDVVSSALHILTAGWGDYRLVRRALLHAAGSARPDGLVAGSGPGEIIYLGTYAAQWVTACLEVATAEGSVDLLRVLEEPAEANINALIASIDDSGVHTLPWSFVDWGYSSPVGAVDLAVIAHVLGAVESWISWRKLLDRAVDARWEGESARLRKILSIGLADQAAEYHALTLASHTGVIPGEQVAEVLFAHIEEGFPVNQSAPRLRDPSQVKADSVTPYFTNYSVSVLLEMGHGQRVAQIWRSAWGWMLERGATTWWEVFDERWSQCHYWSAAPTWQISRFGLGLHAALDQDGSYVRLRVNDLGLSKLSGALHLPLGCFAEVRWAVEGDVMNYSLTISRSTVVELQGERRHLAAGSHDLILRRIGASSLFA